MKNALLGLPVGQAVTKYILRLCKKADEACIRLLNSDDIEALHDFRVAIRRIRTWVRAYHLYLPLHKSHRKQLRVLAARTNIARDSEVSADELQEFVNELTMAQKVGLNWLLVQLQRARQQAYVDLVSHVSNTWPQVAKELRRHLRKEGRESSENFSQISYELSALAAVELVHELGSIVSLQDVEAIHQARIGAKRLRYLLEPFQSDIKGMKEAVKYLTELQDSLGGIHDGYILEQKLIVAVEEAAIQRASHLLGLVLENPDTPLRTIRSGHDKQLGLLALARLNALKQKQQFRVVQVKYLGKNSKIIMDEIESTIGRLANY